MEIKHSLINEKISKFYVKNIKQTPHNVDKYFNVDGTLNFVRIVELLSESNKLPDLDAYEYEQFLQCYNKLLPIFVQSEFVLAKETSACSLNLEWLGTNTTYLRELLKDSKNTPTAPVECILLMTALLENALSNIYYTCRRRTPPHLLRDLLCTAELQSIFGIETVIFLKILLGKPNSINLRNIVWHGFPKPNEMPTYYITILLLVIHSLGNLLQMHNFALCERAKIAEFDKYSQHFPRCIESIEVTAIALKQLLNNCNWLNDEYKIFWHCIDAYYKGRSYWKFVIIILPQFELLLRLIYGHANEYDVGAKLDEYYITMDSIFESHVKNANANTKHKNKLLLFGDAASHICEGTLKYMYDLFIAPNGPRLRDKVSHGEVTMAAINNKMLCNILLNLACNLFTIPLTTKRMAANNIFKSSLNSYESKFHVNALTAEALKQVHLKLNDFMELNLENKSQLSQQSIDLKETPQLMTNIKIFERPKKESELMLLILKISQLLKQTCSNYEESIKIRVILLAQRELHSKRRRTLEKLFIALPQLCNTLVIIFRNILTIFIRSQCDSIDLYEDSSKLGKLLRFLKHTVKISENFVKYSHKDSNEWIKALELCKNFSDYHERFSK